MPSAEYDLQYLSAGVQVLQEYLLSDEIYWSLSHKPPRGEQPFPQLTLGGLALALARTQARALPGEARLSLQDLVTQMGEIQRRWAVAWEKKASREFLARLKLWADFLDAYRKDAAQNAGRYAYEVTRRVMLDLLEPAAQDVAPEERNLLAGLDRLLKARMRPGAFIWEAELASGFPADRYWYLYGTLRLE